MEVRRTRRYVIVSARRVRSMLFAAFRIRALMIPELAEEARVHFDD
jgi:hypothetical protein